MRVEPLTDPLYKSQIRRVYKIKSKNLALSTVLAALYIALFISLTGISFLQFQIRVADALLPLSIIFGWPAIIGLTIGTFLSNTTGGLGPVDMIGGALANFVATFLMWKMRKIKLFNSIDLSNILIILCGNLIITIIVGSYLSFLLFIPLDVTIIGVFFGSLISMNIIGYILLKALHSRLNLK